MARNSFRYPDLIGIKRDGGSLTREQVKHFIDGVVSQDVHDSQLGAMLMAIFFNGMNEEEIIGLTDSMINSGESLSWPSEWEHLVVDKHSSGGVGDKVSLPLVPALAACGLKVPMISGRSLGFTGGTLDKLESIPGFRTALSKEEIFKVVDEVGCCIVAQTKSIVPADKIVYSIRDITGTVACIPLIASSIVSKKAAENLKALVLDVKCGKGCFNKTMEVAEELANSMVRVGEGLGIKTTAFITEMDNPIGKAVGNSVEVAEALQCLDGNGPADLEELVCKQAGELLVLGKIVASFDEGYQKILSVLRDGSAKKKFKEMIIAQGVDKSVAETFCSAPNVFDVLPLSKYKTEINVDSEGVITAINAEVCAQVTTALGAGRTKPGEPVLHDVGIHIHNRVGDHVSVGDTCMTVYHKHELLEDGMKTQLANAITVSNPSNSSKLEKSRFLRKISNH